ncbi:MAG TPA: IS1380 family transposase [Terriglobales bacterium]|nr:IS1380 family transposase [Terriglobales bacterium]
MKKRQERSPAEGEFLFEIDERPLEETITAWGGIPLLARAIRSLGVPGSVQRHLRIKQRERGFDEATYIESFVVLNGVGGDCLEDFDPLREDAGLAEMLGHAIPSAEAARKFLYQFHDAAKIEQAQQELGLDRVAYIPGESEPLQALAAVNRDVVQELGRRCASEKIATVDLDATIIESWKREAKPTYEGGSGYQPVLALWAEMNAVVADEFRDGNVPAAQQLLPVAQRAFQALPETVEEFYFRGDSACDEEGLLSWLRDEKREDGPRAKIGFAVSARMHAGLQAAVRALGEARWQPYSQDARAIKECAEVDYVPEESAGNRYREPLRYVAIRIRKKQGELFADGSAVKHFAVLSNLWEWPAKKLLQWHREKAGSIEAAHDVIKNELAGGVMPSKYFGANAAWLRLAVLTFNVLTALKRLALPPELLAARPKRLRFLIFTAPGKLVHHARRTLLRLQRSWNRFGNWRHAFGLLPLPVLC